MTDQKTIGLLGWTEMWFLSLIWGGSFLANRIALEGAPVATVVCEHRLSTVPAAARRCPFCTSELEVIYSGVAAE